MLEEIGTTAASKTARTGSLIAGNQPPRGALKENSMSALRLKAFAATSLQIFDLNGTRSQR